jgi:hypothetical protein
MQLSTLEIGLIKCGKSSDGSLSLLELDVGYAESGSFASLSKGYLDVLNVSKLSKQGFKLVMSDFIGQVHYVEPLLLNRWLRICGSFPICWSFLVLLLLLALFLLEVGGHG